MQTYTRTREGQTEVLQRCSECWTKRDGYPHWDNGYQVANEPYQHAAGCPTQKLETQNKA